MSSNTPKKISKTDKQQDAVLIQRYVSKSHKQPRWVVKDPANKFSVIGVIRQSRIAQEGKEMNIYHLYSINGKELATETDPDYLMTKKLLEVKQELVKGFNIKQQEGVVQTKTSKTIPAAHKKNTTDKPAVKPQEKEAETLER